MKLQAEFMKWKKAVGFQSFGERQQIMMQMAFYSGSLATFALVCDISEHGNEDIAVTEMDNLNEEIHHECTLITKEL